jgi:hypothetical protein
MTKKGRKKQMQHTMMGGGEPSLEEYEIKIYFSSLSSHMIEVPFDLPVNI